MDIISDYKCIVMYTLVLAFQLAAVNRVQGNCTPLEEVVSIYNDNFKTPCHREPYFIKVFRCGECLKCGNNIPKQSYAIPTKSSNFTVVVKDINQPIFYKHIVYSHTSCACGVVNKRKGMLYGKHQTVDESYYHKNVDKNPARITDCSTPHTRQIYKDVRVSSEFFKVPTCLPWCKTTNRSITKTFYPNNGATRHVTFNISGKCESFGNETRRYPMVGSLTGSLQLATEVSGYPLSIYIDSPNVLIAAFLLTLILMGILIMDLNFCCRKRGFFYSLFNCKTRAEKTNQRSENTNVETMV